MSMNFKVIHTNWDLLHLDHFKIISAETEKQWLDVTIYYSTYEPQIEMECPEESIRFSVESARRMSEALQIAINITKGQYKGDFIEQPS